MSTYYMLYAKKKSLIYYSISMICVLFHIYIGKWQKTGIVVFKLLVTFEFEKIYSLTTSNTFLALCHTTMSQCVKNRKK